MPATTILTEDEMLTRIENPTTWNPQNMTRLLLVEMAHAIHAEVPTGGLTRANRAALVALVDKRRTEMAEYFAEVKPFKVERLVDRFEVDRVRHQATVSPLNIDHWRDETVAAIESAEQSVLVAEFAGRADATAEAERRNRGAARGFCYVTAWVDASLAELRSLDD